MQIQLKVTKDSPVQAYRHYAILRDGEQVGTFSKGADRRWNVQIVRNRDEAWSMANMMTGRLVEEAIGTPYACSVASESYWCS